MSEDIANDTKTTERERSCPDPAGSVPTEWLKKQAKTYRAKAEKKPTEFREYRRMAWACEFVREAWEEAQNAKITHGMERAKNERA